MIKAEEQDNSHIGAAGHDEVDEEQETIQRARTEELSILEVGLEHGQEMSLYFEIGIVATLHSLAFSFFLIFF